MEGRMGGLPCCASFNLQKPQAVFFSLFFPIVLYSYFRSHWRWGWSNISTLHSIVDQTLPVMFFKSYPEQKYSTFTRDLKNRSWMISKKEGSLPSSTFRRMIPEKQIMLLTSKLPQRTEEFPTLKNILNGILNSVEASLHQASHHMQPFRLLR